MEKFKEYLNYDKIKKFSEENKSNGNITVRCYYNGLYWVCPNPKDINRSKGVEESYNAGYFISYCDIRITDEQFNDPKNWNS